MKLKLGVIGLSEGNGHPYSWSAIFNGYNPEAMEQCGFPVIPRYLEQQVWPNCQISNAEVVAIWTQDPAVSAKIATAAKIPHIVSAPEQMIGKVDAILLARDDAENHLEHAKPFLDAGLPIYIDKPIALSVESLNELYTLERYPGQIFTCSALRYSKELSIFGDEINKLGSIRQIVAFTPKSWNKYAVHIIEPVLKMVSDTDQPEHYFSDKTNKPMDGARSLKVRWRSGLETSFFATGDGITPISIRIIGTHGYKELQFSDTFPAFKSALEAFIDGIRNKNIASPRNFNQRVVRIIEEGQ